MKNFRLTILMLALSSGCNLFGAVETPASRRDGGAGSDVGLDTGRSTPDAGSSDAASPPTDSAGADATHVDAGCIPPDGASAPVITVEVQNEGEWILLGDTVTLDVRVEDDGVVEVEMLVDGQRTAGASAPGTVTFGWGANTLGTHEIEIIATDDACGVTRQLLEIVVAARVQLQQGQLPDASYQGVHDTILHQIVGPELRTWERAYLQADGSPRVTALVRWELPELPTDARVLDATVTLFPQPDTSAPYYLFEVLRPWNQEEASWEQAAADQAWEMPGCTGPSDRADVVLGEILLDQSEAPLVFASAEVRDTVSRWVADPASNHGLVIQDPAFANNDGADIHSSEYSDPSMRPLLEFVYTVD